MCSFNLCLAHCKCIEQFKAIVSLTIGHSIHCILSWIHSHELVTWIVSPSPHQLRNACLYSISTVDRRFACQYLNLHGHGMSSSNFQPNLYISDEHGRKFWQMSIKWHTICVYSYLSLNGYELELNKRTTAMW